MKKTNLQSGAVSLFVVIFAALLITIVTVSFVRIMIQNQQQSTANDLSQSAYDSAQAGVEDAKRAILQYVNKCNGGNCDLSIIDSKTCNLAVGQLTDVIPNKSNSEVKVQTTGDGGNMNQAYTCVTISMNTDYVVGFLKQDASEITPLVGTSDFDTIKIDWFTSYDSNGGDVSGTNITNIDVPLAGSTPLLSQDSWLGTTNNSRPSIMRAQLIQFNTTDGFSLDDFNGSSDKASNNTLFLYPSTISAGTNSFLAIARPSVPGGPIQEYCDANISAGGYACSATLSLPKKVDSNHAAYLNLKSLFRASHYQIELYDSTKPIAGTPGTLVQFNGVQPSIDSTGRANDLFRRVQSRVSLKNDNFPFPQAEINITGNLCKTFFVTNDAGTYSPGSSCTP